MMDQMQKDSIPVNEYTYSAAISACGKGGQSSKALDLLDEMVTIGEKDGGVIFCRHTFPLIFSHFIIVILFNAKKY